MPTRSDLPIDSDLVRTLAALLDETGLTEIEYSVGDRRIRVARTAAALASTVAVAAPAQAEAPATAPSAVAPVDHPGAVKAPMVGTAYIAPQPDQPPFVKLGDRVEEGKVLLIIEAMKVMNPIPAPEAGTIEAVLIGDGQPVEYGEALLVLK